MLNHSELEAIKEKKNKQIKKNNGNVQVSKFFENNPSKEKWATL